MVAEQQQQRKTWSVMERRTMSIKNVVKFSEKVLKTVHRTSIRNKMLTKEATDCACFCCLAHFSESEIEEYWEDASGFTAVCPKCHIDSVISEQGGKRVDDDLLKAMKASWFWK